MSAPKKQKSNSGAAIPRGGNDDTFDHVVDEVTATGTYRLLAFRDRATTSNKDLKALAHLTQVDSLDLTDTKISSVGFSRFMKAYTLNCGVGIRNISMLSRGSITSDRMTQKYLDDIVGRCAVTLEELHLSLPSKCRAFDGLSELSQCKTMNLYFKGTQPYQRLPPLLQVTNLKIETYGKFNFACNVRFWLLVSSIIYKNSLTLFSKTIHSRHVFKMGGSRAADGRLANVKSLTLNDELTSANPWQPLTVNNLHAIVTPLTSLRELSIRRSNGLVAGGGVDAVVTIADAIDLDRRNLHLWAAVPLADAGQAGDEA
jgi:hypothetical protein